MLEKTFCSSPWFHMRLAGNGHFETCRWAYNPEHQHNFSTQSIIQFYNSKQMRQLRENLLEGESPSICQSCYYEESFNKLSGRLRQLNKSAVHTENFALTLRSSPHYEMFFKSYKNSGYSNYYPTDFQIDLGNLCNSGCIMCNPTYSSRLETDYKKLHKISSLFVSAEQSTSWSNDNLLKEKLITELLEIPQVKYIHFLGGETFYHSAFYEICEALIKAGKSSEIIIGTTTNATIYNTRLESLISNFKEFHLGISIESITKLNDYIRYPSQIDNVLENINNFLQLRNLYSNLQISLRITPNIFSIYEIDKLFEFMIQKNLIAESCNILADPAHLRMELLPFDIRQEVIKKLSNLIKKYNLNKHNVVNVRRNDLIDKVIANTILDYGTFIESYETPVDADKHRYNLVEWLKSFEQLRKNSILDYAPRYEEFLRNYGY